MGPEQWVQGINAAFVGYNANLYYSEQESIGEPLSSSINLNTGINLGGLAPQRLLAGRNQGAAISPSTAMRSEMSPPAKPC